MQAKVGKAPEPGKRTPEHHFGGRIAAGVAVAAIAVFAAAGCSKEVPKLSEGQRAEVSRMIMPVDSTHAAREKALQDSLKAVRRELATLQAKEGNTWLKPEIAENYLELVKTTASNAGAIVSTNANVAGIAQRVAGVEKDVAALKGENPK